MNRKIILIIIVVVVVLSVIIYQFFIKDGEPEFAFEKVSIGTVLKEISETGTVKISEEINLGFKNSGRIGEIYVKVGDIVETGQKLAKLDASQLYIELTEAQAALEVAQADYNKLLAGSSSEEIKVAETEVLNAQVTLENAQQNLKNIETDAEEDLKQAYEDAIDTLDDAYLKIYNSFNVTDSIYRSYFTSNDQEGIRVKDSRNKIKNALNQTKSYIDNVKSDPQDEKIDTALSEVKDALEDTRDALEVIRDVAETPLYRDAVSSSDKTSLDNQKSYVNTVRTDVINDQQTISTTKITNDTNINDAKADIATAEAKLQKAQDELALKEAGPTQENIDLYLAKIKQAQAKVSLLQNKIQETVLKSSNGGQIIKINKREGEVIQPTDSVISFLSAGPFQVEVDIYEEDIVNVKIDNPVEITLAAFPDEILKGRVISIDPAEKLVEGIVYYEVTIGFEKNKEGIKPGMTADIIIESDKKENILVIPKRAVKKIDGKKIVQVFKDSEVKEREIEIGLEGDEFFEVVSGLNEGEEVVIE